jgi:hypothetical protein
LQQRRQGNLWSGAFFLASCWAEWWINGGNDITRGRTVAEAYYLSHSRADWGRKVISHCDWREIGEGLAQRGACRAEKRVAVVKGRGWLGKLELEPHFLIPAESGRPGTAMLAHALRISILGERSAWNGVTVFACLPLCPHDYSHTYIPK